MTAARRRHKGVVLAVVMAVGVILGVPGGMPAHSVYANKATSTSKYAEVIDWLDWTEVVGAQPCTYTVGRTETTGMCIPANPSLTARMWSTPALVGSGSDGSTTSYYFRATRCTLTPTYTDSAARPNGILLYEPGAYRGDGLARLVNNGANYLAGGTPIANTLTGNYRSGYTIGLANQYEGWRGATPGVDGIQGVDVGDAGIVSFRVACNTYLFKTTTSTLTKSSLEGMYQDTSVARRMTMVGMVVADVESSNWDSTHHEYIAVQSSATNSRVLETYRTADCTDPLSTSQITTMTWTDTNGSHSGYRMNTVGSQCASTVKDSTGTAVPTAAGPTAILFMEGASSLDVRVAGNGRSAVALGVVSYMDFGDAPQTYGVAGAAFQPTWSGGVIPTNTTTNLFTGLTPATAGSAVPRLGALIDAETIQQNSVGATGDDDATSDDEDGWTVSDIRTRRGAAYSTTVSCTGTGLVKGWIDWNRNGTFDTSDGSTNTPTCGTATSTVTLSWTVPADVKRSVAGETDSAKTYLRLRISADRNAVNALIVPDATGGTTTGEVEDYAVNVFVPTIQFKKNVDNTWAGSLGLVSENWTLTGTQSARTWSGAGYAQETTVMPGDVSIKEASTVAGSSAYTASQWTCRQADGTVNPSGYSYSSTVTSTTPTGTVSVNDVDRVICEITNTAKPGSLTWKKVDDAGQPIGGATFTLNGPSAANVAVVDCVAPGCAVSGVVDTNPNPGEFTVKDLIWGDYTITETVPPAGHVLTAQTATGTLSRTTSHLLLDLGEIVNTPNHLTWTKVDADNAALLGGSQWTLSPSDGAATPTITIRDCKSAGCTGPDMDPDPGEFDLTKIPAGTYTLTETEAPAGYQIGDPVTVDVKATDTTITLAPIPNTKQPVPALPLTGGTASDWFLLGGGGAGLLALVLGVARRRRS